MAPRCPFAFLRAPFRTVSYFYPRIFTERSIFSYLPDNFLNLNYTEYKSTEKLFPLRIAVKLPVRSKI